MNQNGDSDNENTQKENFLYQEIIGQGYDPDQFENYAQKLFPDKDTVADWSFDELRQVILDFKQQQDYIQQQPQQMKSSKIVPRQIQINSIELDSNISIDEFRRYVKCKDQQFCLDQKINLNFQVSEHIEKNPLKKLINEIEYEIKTINLNYCVKRKYSDFQSLNKNLQIIYPEYEYQFIKLPDKINSPVEFQNLLVEFYKKPISRIFEAAKSFLCNQKLFDDQKYQNYFNQLQAKSSQSGFLEISLSKQSYETNQQIINFMKCPENLKSIDYIKKAELKFKEGFQQINLALDSFNAHNDQIPNSFKKELTNKTIKLKNLLKETSWHFQLSLFGFSGTLNQIFIQFQNISNNLDQQIKKNTQLQLNLYNYYKDSFIPSQKKFLANQNVIEALKNMNLKLETINQVKIYENVCRTLTKSNPSLVPIELEKLEEIQNETAYYITQTNIYSKQIFEETFQNIDAIIQKYQTTTLEDNKKHNFCFNENVVWIEFFDIFKKILQLMSLKYETIISQFLEKLKPKLPLKNNQIKDALQTFLGQNHLEFGNHIILFKWAIQIKSQKIKELTIQTLINLVSKGYIKGSLIDKSDFYPQEIVEINENRLKKIVKTQSQQNVIESLIKIVSLCLMEKEEIVQLSLKLLISLILSPFCDISFQQINEIQQKSYSNVYNSKKCIQDIILIFQNKIIIIYTVNLLSIFKFLNISMMENESFFLSQKFF